MCNESTAHVPGRDRLKQLFLRPMFWFGALALITMELSRGGLVLWQADRVAATGSFVPVFVQGLRFDLVVLGTVLLPAFVLVPPCMAFERAGRRAHRVLVTYLAGLLGVVLFTEFATPSFIAEYDVRPNYLFVEYLRYPKEVFSMLWVEHPAQLVSSVFGVAATFLLFRRLLLVPREATSAPSVGRIVLTVLAGAGVSFICARSSFKHRPVNPSVACYSSDALVNTLALPSVYSSMYAIYEMGKNEGDDAPYGSMDFDRAVEVVKQSMGIDPGRFVPGDPLTAHRQTAFCRRDRPLNLVIILEESLGAEFVGSLGGADLTPHLDELLESGIAFDRLYATGTRSVRGIEAVVTGFPPTPAQSVVKRPRSQRGFFTLARLLRDEGYQTSFLYGGESHFDNMARFFTGNGFGTIVDDDDFDEPLFEGSWGACDQDLFRKADETLERYGDKPFFSLIFTSSNHSPWEFPEGQVEVPPGPMATRENAVRYADFALGEFFQTARASSYWDRTVFLVVADHNSRVHGASLVPVERFHIPAVFMGADLEPEHVGGLCSQVDLLPTALSLIGLDAVHPAIGRDLMDPMQRQRPGCCILQYHDTQLLLEEDHGVVLRPGPSIDHVSWDGHELHASLSPDAALEERALAIATFAQGAYLRGLYR